MKIIKPSLYKVILVISIYFIFLTACMRPSCRYNKMIMKNQGNISKSFKY